MSFARWVPPLRSTLLADSLVCFVFGGVFALAATPLASLLVLSSGPVSAGTRPDEIVRIVGLVVIGIGLFVLVTAKLNPIIRAFVYAILFVEVAWIGGTVALLLLYRNELTFAGEMLAIAAALAVFVFLVLEALGMKALNRNSARHSVGK